MIKSHYGNIWIQSKNHVMENHTMENHVIKGITVPSLPTGFMSGLILLCINVVIILSFFVRI